MKVTGNWRLTGLRTIEFDKYESDEEDDSE